MDNLIVYVDDDIDDLQLLKEAFAEVDGCEVNTLQSAEALFEFLQNCSLPVSLLILDINMPMMNGIEILKQLKKSTDHSGIPIVMLSTSITIIEKEVISNMGVEILQKPSSYNDVKNLAYRLREYC